MKKNEKDDDSDKSVLQTVTDALSSHISLLFVFHQQRQRQSATPLGVDGDDDGDGDGDGKGGPCYFL